MKPSATYGLNTVILGLLKPGDHVIASTFEHNSVIRPLNSLNCEISWLNLSLGLDLKSLEASIKKNTKLVVICQASNVTGSIQDIHQISEITNKHNIPLLIDSSQSAGIVPINYQDIKGQAYVVSACHKALYGIQGVSILIVPDHSLKQTIFGGTGVKSELLTQPEIWPLRHEVGTPNLLAYAALLAGIESLSTLDIGKREVLVTLTRKELSNFKAINLTPLANNDGRVGIVSFWHDVIDSNDLGLILAESFDIITRSGLHCAPLIHKDLKVKNTIRISFSSMNSILEVETFLKAMKKICR